MATWPTSNPSATTTDAASDSISGARADINQTIDNIIEVVDMFNIPASPTDNYILKYNASTSVFDMEADVAGVITSVTNMVDNRVITASGSTTLNGEANLTFDGSALTLASSTIAMGTGKITGLGDPGAAQDAATKAYVDATAVGVVTAYTNGTNNRVITSTSTTGINGEANLTFNGSFLILGNMEISDGKIEATSGQLNLEAQNEIDIASDIIRSGTDPVTFADDVLVNGTTKITDAPTFTEADTPIQLTGTQPNPGGYYGYITVDNGTSRGAYNYSSRTAGGGGPNADRHIFFFDLDNDFSARPVGAYQGDQNIWINANHSADRADFYFDGFSTAGISAYGHGGNSYALQALELNGSTIKLQSGGTNIISIDSDSVDITQDVVITDTEQLKFGTTTTIDKDEITTTGAFTVNVDSNNSGNEAFVVQSAGTDVLSFSRGPGGDAEMTVKGDGLFFKGDDDKTNLSMDLSSATQTGINVIRSDENKSLSFTLKTLDVDDTGNYDGHWSFRTNANEKSLILERVDGSAVEIFEVRDSAGVATADPIDVFEFKIPPSVPSYAVGSLPTTVIAGAQALATGCNSSDVSTGTAMSFFDGTNWKYTHLPATTVRT